MSDALKHVIYETHTCSKTSLLSNEIIHRYNVLHTQSYLT